VILIDSRADPRTLEFMVSLTGTFLNFLSRRVRAIAFALLTLTTVVTASAALPAYVREALNKLNPEVPVGWAFTITTERGDNTTVERYDPSKPMAERWVLLQFKGLSPTPADVAKYNKLKAANPTPVSQASFNKADIEPTSLKLVSEDDERAHYEGAFREIAAESDKMLGRLRLRLTINKRHPYVEAYDLDLIEPYSPVLGVKMNSLVARMTFTPPAPDRPSFPAEFTSDFTGRIFFIGTSETLRVACSDYVRVQ
jgi:hypothetical protein